MSASSGVSGSLMSRRRVVSWLAASLVAGAGFPLGLTACGSDSSGVGDLAFVDPVAPDAPDFAGAQLAAIMRSAGDDVAVQISEEATTWEAKANATIELDFRSDWREEYKRVAADATGPDIAELFGSAPHLLANKLVDVTDIAEEAAERLGAWFDFARDAVVVDGVWRAVPWAYTGHAVNYRQDLLAEIGMPAPQSFDELLQIATMLDDADLPRAAFSMSPMAANDSANFAYSMLWSFGGHEVDESGGRVTIDSAATRAALSYFRELAAVSDPAAAEFDEFANNAAFLDGNIAMTQNAATIYRSALTDQPDIATVMNHVQYPTGPAGRHQLVEINEVGVFRHSRNVDAAKSWVRFATQPEQLLARSASSFGFYAPPIDGVTDDPRMPWNFDDKLKGLKGSEEGAHLAGWPGPPTIEGAFVYENGSIVRMFAGAAAGTESIDSLVRTAVEELVRVYET